MIKDISKKRRDKAAAEKESAEFEAKYNAQLERRNLEKSLSVIDASIKALTENAVKLKQAGLPGEVDRVVAQLQLAEIKKRQVQAVIVRIDTMLEVQKLNKVSSDVLSSINSVMQGLGKIAFGKKAVEESGKVFDKTRNALVAQASEIDKELDSKQARQLDEENPDFQVSADDIMKNIDALAAQSAPVANAQESGNSAQIEEIKKILNSVNV